MAVLTLVGGSLLLTALIVVQIHLIGVASYYGLKLVMGFKLMLAGLVPGLVGIVVARIVKPLDPLRGWVVGAAVMLMASQSLGSFPRGPGALHETSNQGSGTAGLETSDSNVAIARGVLRAVRAVDGRGALNVEYFPLGKASTPVPLLGDDWFHSVSQSLSMKVFDRFQVWNRHPDELAQAAEMMRAVLLNDPTVRIMVDDAFVQPVRRRLADAALEARVMGTESMGEQNSG